MAHVIFYEKPGCKGNARQRRMLLDSGHDVEARSLLDTPWTGESLRPFLANLPVQDWFNRSAAPVKNGEVDPARLSADDALVLLVQQPILIRRPLLQVGEERRMGFDVDDISQWIGLSATAVPAGYEDGCMTKHSESHCHPA